MYLLSNYAREYGLLLTLCFCVMPVAAQKDTIKSIKGHKSSTVHSKPKPAPARRPSRSSSTPVHRIVSRPSPPKPSTSHILVSRLGQGQFKTIGEAIRNAKPGAKIVVRPGVYEE